MTSTPSKATAGPQYRDFSDMPDDALRSLANAMDAIARGEKLKDVIAALKARALASRDDAHQEPTA